MFSKAQAQECVLEKSITDNRKHSINAKISAQVTEYYKSCAQSCTDAEFIESVGYRRAQVKIKEITHYLILMAKTLFGPIGSFATFFFRIFFGNFFV